VALRTLTTYTTAGCRSTTRVRVAGRDGAEVAATKAAQQLGLPIFVVTYRTPSSSVRNVG